MNNNKLRIVMPKKGRLKEDFERIMQEAGFLITKENNRQDYGIASDNQAEINDFEILFQRPNDGLKRINSGIAILAIVGTDNFAEMKYESMQTKQTFKSEIATEFNGISECELYIAAPINKSIKSTKDLNGCRFSTSYPAILKSWLVKNNIKDFSILTCDGGVEDTIRLGEADVICDVVESGRTLKANGLETKIKLMNSRAILVKSTAPPSNEMQKQIEQIKNRLIEANLKLKKITSLQAPELRVKKPQYI